MSDLRQTRVTDPDETGRDGARARGSDRAGSDRAGSDRAGSRGRAGGAPARVVRRGPRDAEGLAAVDLQVDVPADVVPRVVGPGRKERAYQQRIADAERELELARLVERGANRRLDRLETEVRDARQLERRLLVALGALQEQNRALRAQNADLLGDRARDAGRRLGPAS